MKYYAEHEIAYQRLLNNEYIGWDRQKSVEELLSIPYRCELDEVIKHFPRGSNAIDVGCGTGTVALYLARAGFNTTGIDVSSTAIAKANELADALKCSAFFISGDFLEADFPPAIFDIAVDSSFLHCIVFDEDRAKTLEKIASSLRRYGKFIVHTMVSDRAANFGPDFELDDQGILWYLSNSSDISEARPHPRRDLSQMCHTIVCHL